jgi:spore germination protein KB
MFYQEGWDLEPGRISNRQLAFLMATVLLATVIYFMPQVAARAVQQDSWITALLSTVWAILVVLTIIALSRRFPGLTLIEYLPLILGKPLGKLLGLFYVFWFLGVGAFVLRQFAMLLNIAVMPATPVAVFMVTMMVLVVYALRGGLEVWTRVNEILLPIIIVALLMIMVLPYESMDFRRLLPVASHPAGVLMVSSLIGASWRGEIFMAAMFIPALTSSRHTSRNLMLMVLIVGLILAAMEVATVAVFGGVNAGELELPIFSLARMISLAKIFDRLEVLIVFTWVLGNFIKICVFMYCSTVGAAQVMGFKKFDFLFFPIAVLMVALGDNFLENVADFTDFLTHVWGAYGLLSFELVIPFILLLITLIRKPEVKRDTR